MSFKILSTYFLLVAFLTGCMGGGNEELAEGTFGISMSVTPDNQTLEDPATLAQDIVVTVKSDDGSPSKNSKISFKLLNPDSGATLLAETGVTDKSGKTSTQVIGGDDFGKIAHIKVSLNGTNLSKLVKVAIRTKIVPTQIQIVDPPLNIIAGKPFQVALRLVDDSGRVAVDEEFNTGFEIQVTTRSISGFTVDPTKFNKTAAVDRVVTFEDGIGYIQGATYTKAEDVIFELYDHGANIDLMKSRTGRDFSIAASKTFRFVPDVPIRAQLQNITNVTTDDAAKGEIFIFDQYDNHAYNFPGVCSFVVNTVGDNLDEAYIVDQGDSNLRNKTGVATVAGGVGRFDVRDTNVETATNTVAAINNGCAGITALGSPEDVDFTVGSVAKIVIRQPVAPNDQAKTTEEIALDIEATDLGGNLTTSFSGLVGIDFDGGCSADINNDDEEVANSRNIRAGLGKKTIRVFNRYLDRKNAETCLVSLRSTAETVAIGDLTSTATIRFVPGDAKQFAFVNALTNGEVGWGTSPTDRNKVTVEVEQLDTWNNPIISGGNAQTVKVVSDGSSEINTTGTAKTVTFDSAGKGSFDFYNTKNETINLLFFGGTPGMRYTTANAENVAVENQSTLYEAQVYFKWGIPTQAVILDPANGDVDNPISVTVQMQDYGGNVVQDFGIASTPRTELKMEVNSGTTTLMDALQFVSGTSVVRAQNTKEEVVDFNLNFNDGVTSFKNSKGMDVSFNGTVQDAYYKWGNVGRKFLLEDPADGTVDDKISFKVQVVDQYNNPIRDYGCAGGASDAQVNVNGTAKISLDGSFDHTNQGAFDALTQSVFVDIKQQVGVCPISNPETESSKDASYGNVHVYVREISPYAADYQTITVTMDDTAGTGYDLSPGSGVGVSFLPGAVEEYRMLSVAGTVDDPIEVPVEVLDQFGNKVVSYAEPDAVTFKWIFQGSDGGNLGSINLNADGIPANGDDRAPGDLFIDFKAGDRGTGYIYLSATVAEQLQVGLEAKAGFVTNVVADVLFNAGVVTQMDISPQQAINTITTDAKVHFGVRALDQYGNLNTDYSDNNISVSGNKSAKILLNPAETNPDNYLLNSPVPITITSGVGDFYAYDPVKETATLSMVDSINRGYTLIPLDVVFLHGNPVNVTIAKITNDVITIPTTMTADTKSNVSGLIKIEVQDRNGNIADTYNQTGAGSIQISAGAGGVDSDFVLTTPAADDLPTAGDATPLIVDIVSGEGQAYLLARKVGAVNLFINPLSTGLNAEPASDETMVTVNVVHGDTKKFGIFEQLEVFSAGGTLSNFPSATINGTTDNNISMKVVAYDYYNNKATTDENSQVIFSIDKQAYLDPASIPFGSSLIGVAPYKSVTLDMNGGEAGFEIRDLKKESGITTSLANPSDPAVDVGHIRPVNVDFGIPHYFAIIKPPASTSVDNIYLVDVEVRDANHNVIDNGFVGEVDFSVDGDAFLNDTFIPATGKPSPGSEIQTRKLDFLAGNTGVAQMGVYNRKSETVTLSLEGGTGKNLTDNSSLQVTDLLLPSEQKTLTYFPGYPKSFTIDNPAIADSFGGVDYHSDADNTLEVVAKAYDKYGNYCNNYSEGDAIQISLSAPSNQPYVTTVASPNDINADDLIDFGSAGGFAQGEGRIIIRDKYKENITVTLVDVKADGVDWTANTVVVKNKWGAPKMFHIGTITGDDPTGNNGPRALRADVLLRVESVAKDDYGNVVLDFNGQCDLAVTGQQVFYPEGQTFSGYVNGVADLGYEQRLVGSSTVRLVDNVAAPVMRDHNLEANAQQIITVVPGVPEQFAYIDPLDPVDGNPSLDIIAGMDLLVTIEAQDKWGNRATTFDGAGADSRVTYTGGTGTTKDSGNNYVTNPVPFTFTGGAATVTFRNQVLDRAVSGPKNEPLKGETVTVGFLSQTDTSGWTADGNPMDYTNTLDITYYPDTAERLEVVDYQASGPYSVDDPVELRVEARDQFGNYTDDYTGNFNLSVDKNAWTYQGLPESDYQILPTLDLDGQNTGEQLQAKTVSSNGWEYVSVANLTSENNVTISASGGTNGITGYDPVLISWMHGTGTYYDIVFTDAEGLALPQFSTDKVRPVEVRVLDKGENVVLAHPTHDVRVVSDAISKEFTGDDAGDDGKITITGGVGSLNYRSRDDVISTLQIDTAPPGLYAGVTNSTQQAQFLAGTVSKLVFVAPLTMSADDVLIAEQAYYDANTPTCTTSPGAQVCPYPTQIFRIEPQDQFGNINEIEGSTKRYDITVIAHESGVPANVIWSQAIEIVDGVAWLDYDAGTLFSARLVKSQGVDVKLANPTPASQPDEDSNNIVLDYSTTSTIGVTPGSSTRLWITDVADGTIDFAIPITIEVQDAHDIDGNGNGNLVTDATDLEVGMEFYQPGTAASGKPAVSAVLTGARNAAYVSGGPTEKDTRDDQTVAGNDGVSGSSVTIRKGIGVFNVEDLTAEDVEVSLFDAAGGTNEGDNGVYFTPAFLPGQAKVFKFDPGVPTRYKIVLIDSSGSLYDDAAGDKLNIFDFEVRAYDKGNNFTPGQTGWAYVTVDNTGGGDVTVIATPDASEDDGASVTNGTGVVVKNVAVSGGIGPVSFKAKKSGTARLSVTSTSGLIADPNVPEVTINPGPGYEVVIINPDDIRTTLSTDVSEWNDNGKNELSVLEIRTLDYFQNVARDVSGTIFLVDDSDDMESIDAGDNVSASFVFTAGIDGIKSLRLRNDVAENVSLDLGSSTLQNGNADPLILPNSPSDSINAANIPQDIIFSPGPVAQLSLEIDDSWDDSVKEDDTATVSHSDAPVSMTVRTRDIYGNWNNENNYTNEVVLNIVPRQGTAVSNINDLSANETLSITAGKVDFNVKLLEFGNNGFFAGDARNFGQDEGMDFIDVTLTSNLGFNIYNSGAGPVKHPRRLYYHAGSAVGLTMDNPPDTSTDDLETIKIYARDQYGNVDKRYGTACDRHVTVKIFESDGTTPAADSVIYEMDGTTANEDVCFVNGVAEAKIGSTRAGLLVLKMEDDAGSLAGVSPDTLNPLVDGEFDNEQDIYFSPGEPLYFIFTDKKKSQFDFIDPNGGAPANTQITHDTSNTRITVDNTAFVYMYAVDQGGNVCSQIDANDRFTVSFNKPDGTIDTGDTLYGDFVDGEAKFIIGRQKSYASDGYAILSVNLQGADIGTITPNNLQVNFDHGRAVKFDWTVPASETSIDSIAPVTIKALDQYDNFNDNYAGTADFSATPNSALTGDINASGQPYLPSNGAGAIQAANNLDVDPSDLNYTGAGVNLSFTAGQLALEVMSLRAVAYTLSVANADITADSNGSPANSNTTFGFKNGSVAQFEIFDPQVGGYDVFDTSAKNIDINISAHDNVTELTTDYYGKIGVQALDRGGNLVTGYNRASALTLQLWDTEVTPNQINSDVDLVAAGGTPYSPASGNFIKSVDFTNNATAIIEMRAKVNMTYEVRMTGQVAGTTERFPSTTVGNEKYITFKNGSLAQVAFLPATDSGVDADKSFTISIEGQDQYGNKAEDYTGWVNMGIDDGSGVKIPSDGDFPTDVFFPTVAGQLDGSIQLVSGVGTLGGYEYHKTNAFSNKTITMAVVEKDADFDATPGLNITAHTTDVVVTAGDPAQIVWDGTPTDATVDTNSQFKLRIEDAYNNLCYEDNANLTVHINGNKYGYGFKKIGGSTGTDTSSSGNAISITNGSETFVVWSQKSETVDLTLSAPSVGSIPNATKDFDFTADVPVELIFTGSDYETPLPSGTIEAGETYSIYVIGRDQFENVAKGFTGTAEVKIHAGANIITEPVAANASYPVVKNLSFFNGQGTVDVKSETMTNPGNLEFRIGNFTGGPSIVKNGSDPNQKHFLTVDHNDATTFTMVADNASSTIDNSVKFTLQAVDDYGNNVDDYSSKVVRVTTSDNYAYNQNGPDTSGDAAGALKYKGNIHDLTTNSSGKVDFYVSSYKAGAMTMTIAQADDYDTGKPMATDATGGTTFTYGAAEWFLIKTPPTNGTVDDPVVVEIEARDRGQLQIDVNYAQSDQVTATITGDSDTNETDILKFALTPTGDPGTGSTSSFVDFAGGVGKVHTRSRIPQTLTMSLTPVGGFPVPQFDSNNKTIPFIHGAWHHMGYKTVPLTPVRTTETFNMQIEAQDQFDNRYLALNSGSIKLIATTGTFLAGSSVAGGSEVTIPSAGVVDFTGTNGRTTVNALTVTDAGKLLLDGTGANMQTVTFGFDDDSKTVPNKGDSRSFKNVQIKHGAIADYKVLNNPTGILTVGNDIDFEIQITDIHGNVVHDLSGIPAPGVDVTLRKGASSPTLLKLDGNASACSGCDHNLTTFVDGVGTVTLNSTKSQTISVGLIDPDGAGGITITGSDSFQYKADVCKRFHFAENGDFTPADPNNLTLSPSTASRNETVDANFVVAIEGLDKYGNLDNTCSESFTLLGNGASDVGFIDWLGGVSPGTFTLSGGVKNVTLRNKKGKSGLTLYLTFADAGTEIGWGSQLDVNMDHGVATQLDMSLPAGTYSIDDVLPVELQALDQYGNLNDNYGSSEQGGATVQLYVSAADAVGPNPGPFVSGPNYLTTARTTAAFANGYLQANIENRNAGSFTLRMQNASGGINTTDTEFITLESGSPTQYVVVNDGDFDTCQSDPSRTSNDDPQSQTGYIVGTGCHPMAAQKLDTDLEVQIRAKDQGNNDAITYNATSTWTVQISERTDIGRILDSSASAAEFNSTTNYGIAGTRDTNVLFTNGLGVVYLRTDEQTYNCHVNMGGYATSCPGRKGKKSLDFSFIGCGGACTSQVYQTYFKTGDVDQFHGENLSYQTTNKTDHSFSFDIVARDGLNKNEVVADFVGPVTLTATDPAFGCAVPGGLSIAAADDGIITVTGVTCRNIPLDGGGNPQLGIIPTIIEVSGPAASSPTDLSVNRLAGTPYEYTIEGSAGGQVATLADGTKYVKVTVSARDEYGNVTNIVNGSVTLNVSSGDNTRVGYDFDGLGAPQGTSAAPISLTNISSQKDVWIKTDLAGSLTLSLSLPNGAPNVEATPHQITFVPDVATTYQIVNHSNGASSATVKTDDWTTIRVQALDQFGNVATGENNKTVTATGSGSGVQFQNPGATVTVNAGIGTTEIRKVVINPTGSSSESMTVGMASPSNGSVNTTHTSTFTVNPGVPKYAVVVSSQASPNVQQSQDTSGIKVDFDLYDQFDNPTKPDSGTVTANATLNQVNTSWNSTATTSTTLSWGAGHTVGNVQSRYIKTTLASSNHRVTMTTPTGGIQVDHATKAVRTVSIIHGNPHHWKMNINDLGTIYVNTDATYAIETYQMDEWDNICNTAAAAPVGAKVTATVTGTPATAYVIDGSGTAVGNNTETTSSGVANSSVRATKKTTLSIQASGGSLASSSPKILNVRWGSPSYMTWTTFATNKATGDAPDSYNVSIYDGFDNHLTGYSAGTNDFSHLGITVANARVTSLGFTPSGAPIGTPTAPTIGPSANVNWSGGTASYTLSGFESAGLFTISADDQSSGSTAPNKSGSITIAPAGATKVWIAPPSGKGIVSQATDVTVYALDNYNNFADTGASVEICSVASGTIPTSRYPDDSNTETTRAYFDNSNTYCKTQSFGGGSSLTFPMNVDQPQGYGFGWTEVNFNNNGGLTVINTSNHEDFYFQPGDPVKYELVMEDHATSGVPTASHFHSTVNQATRDISHLVTGVPRTIQIKAVDQTGAVATTWGGVATIEMSGDAQFSSGNVTVDLTQGTGSFEVYDQYVEDIYIRVVGSSDASISYYNVNNSGTACDTCEINAKVSKSKAQTFQTVTENRGALAWPDSATNKARASHNTGEYFVHDFYVRDESNNIFSEYVGKFRLEDRGYYTSTLDFGLSNGQRLGEWSRNYYPRTMTSYMGPHLDYGGRAFDVTGDNDTVSFVHSSPTQIYVYCPTTSLVSDTASVAVCRLKIKDSIYHSVSAVHSNSWGIDVTNFDGGRIDLNLQDNSGGTHPNAILYWDTSGNGLVEQAEIDATSEATRGQAATLNFLAGKGMYYFGINSTQSGNVKITMENGIYNGNKWHTYLGGAANTDIAMDGIAGPITYQVGDYIDQTVFFQEAPTTDIDLVVTENAAPTNPSTNGASEYYIVTLTAKISNGTTNINDNGFMYVNLNGTGTSNQIASSQLYLKPSAGGSYSQGTSVLTQFVNGVATVHMHSKVSGDININTSFPGAPPAGVTINGNNIVKDFAPNPATKYEIQSIADMVANDQPGHTITIHAVDANGGIDTNYTSTGTLILLEGANNVSALNIDADQNGTKGGETTVNFTAGVATIDIMTLDVGAHSIQVSGNITTDTENFTTIYPTATQIVELSGSRDTSDQGVTIYYYEARDALGNLAGDFSAFYSGAIAPANSSTTGSGTSLFFNNGLSSLTLKSTKAQTVTATLTEVTSTGIDITGSSTNVQEYVFSGGRATGLRLTTQPVGNVTVNDDFEVAMKIDVVDGDDNVVTSGAEATMALNIEAHDGSSCASEIVDSSVKNNDSVLAQVSAAAGTFTWTALESSVARNISFKVSDDAGNLAVLCSQAAAVYDDLSATVDGAVTGAIPTDSVIIEINGGVPPFSVGISTTTDSTAVTVSNSEPGCDGATCVKYTAGRDLASDTITITDSQTAPSANSVPVALDVEAADFSFDDGDDPANAWSTSAENDLGIFTNDADDTNNFIINNSGSAFTSGAKNSTITSANPGMWFYNTGGCDNGTTLAAGANCNAYLTFKASTGSDGPGVYTATLTVQGVNGSAEKTVDFKAELVKTLDIQDPDNSYNAVNETSVNLGSFPNVSDAEKTYRIRNNSTVSSGTLSFTFNEGVTPDMWEMVTDGCNGQDLAVNAYCEVTIRYRAQNGPGGDGNGPHTSDITVTAPNLGTSTITSIQADRF